MKKHRIRSRFAVVMVFVFLMTMLPAEGMIIGEAGEASLTLPAATGENGLTEAKGEPAAENTEVGDLISGEAGNPVDPDETAGNVFTSAQQEDSARLFSGSDISEPWDGSVDFSWYDSSKTEFYLSSPSQLAGLAALVNGMTDKTTPDQKITGDRSLLVTHKIDNFQLTGAGGGNQFSTVYQGDASADFAGKTIYLTKDMDMGGVRNTADGTWSGPNWTPVGGKYPMETSTGEYLIEAFFNGVLDGQGHQIINLYCNRFTERGYAYSQAIGFVGYLGDLYDNETLPEGWQPAVRNLTVNGYVYGRRMVGGVVGRVGSTDSGVIIENCANYAEVRNTDSKGVGGICGAGWGKGIIRNCYNRGNVSTTYACPTGGICGSNGGLDIYNCYNTGSMNSNGQKRGRGIGGHESGSYTVDNCYFIEGCYDDPDHPGYYSGTALNINVNTEEMTESQMKSAELLDALNKNGRVFVSDSVNCNDGFPILYYQAEGYDAGTMYTIRLEQTGGGTVGVAGGYTVPRGTVVELIASPEGGYVFQNYLADGKEFTGAFYTVVKDVTISGKFSVMKKGTVLLQNSETCTVSLQKSGTVMNENGNAESVSRCQTKNGDALYEGDSLTASAHLRKGAVPKDPSKEYTGAFRYTFRYSSGGSSSTERGTHKVSSGIQDGTLTVSAEPITRSKSWSSMADVSWFTGESTEYSIQSAGQLAGLAVLVNKGTDFTGITVSLAQDISLANNDGTSTVREWSAIGSGSSNAFKGTFDGKGHVISEMTAVSAGSYSGLFGYCRDAVIRNVTVKGSSSAQGGAAGIAGHLSGGTAAGCVSRVNVVSTGQYAAGIAAGISDGATVRRCVNYGKISGTSSVAGIVGGSGQMTDQISDCVNYGTVSGSGSLSGGTAGVAGVLGGSVIRCGNYGKVTGKGWYTGGLVGHAGSADTNTMETSVVRDSYNRGEVRSENQTDSATVGGLVGYAQYLNMDNCYNTGTVVLNSPASSYCGSVAGRFYRSVYNRIDHTFVLSGSCNKVMDVDYTVLDYVQVDVFSASDMGTTNFCAGMNDYAGDSVFTPAQFPEFLRLKKNEICTVTFTGAYSGSQQVYVGDPVELPAAPQGYDYSFTVGGIPWTGSTVTGDTTVTVTQSPAVHIVSFYADGRLIAQETYQNGMTSVKEPSIPEKTGYTAHWPVYSLNGGDVAVTAVYESQPAYGGSTLFGNDYSCLAAGATGTITVSAGANATLDGSAGAAEVQIVVEKGASLTLKDVETSYNGSVLVLKGDNRVNLLGSSRIIGASSESNNLNASVLAEGNVTFTGSGLLYADAQSGNAAMQLSPGAVMTVNGPKVELFKVEKLGIDGGVLNGPNGSVAVSRGLLACYSNSDNLFAASVGSYTQTGGSAIFICDDHEHAIRANTMNLTGGSLRVQGRSHEDASVYYEHAEAVECNGFASAYQLSELSVRSLGAPYTVSFGSTSVVDGAYQAVLIDNGDQFEVIPGDTLYVWTGSGNSASVAGVNGVGYTAMAVGNTVKASFHEEMPPGAVIAAAAFRSDGVMLDYSSAEVSAEVSLDLNMDGASVVRISVVKSGEDPAPLMPETELTL